MFRRKKKLKPKLKIALSLPADYSQVDAESPLPESKKRFRSYSKSKSKGSTAVPMVNEVAPSILRGVPPKILLLGTSNSGKSTILKHFKMINAKLQRMGDSSFDEKMDDSSSNHDTNGLFPSSSSPNSASAAAYAQQQCYFGKQEYFEAQSMTRKNCISFLIFLLKKLEIANMLHIEAWIENTDEMESKQKEFDHALRKLLKYRRESWENLSVINWSDVEQLKRALILIWTHPMIQRGYACNGLFYNTISNIDYFLNRVDEIYSQNWHPSNLDVLRSRIRTTGVLQENISFRVSDIMYETATFDVGGARNERRKWFHIFENVHAVIFTVDITGYRHILFEDEYYYDIHESLKLFNELLGYRSAWFKRCRIILLLTHKDALWHDLANGYSLNCVGAFDPNYPIPHLQKFSKREKWWGGDDNTDTYSRKRADTHIGGVSNIGYSNPAMVTTTTAALSRDRSVSESVYNGGNERTTKTVTRIDNDIFEKFDMLTTDEITSSANDTSPHFQNRLTLTESKSANYANKDDYSTPFVPNISQWIGPDYIPLPKHSPQFTPDLHNCELVFYQNLYRMKKDTDPTFDSEYLESLPSSSLPQNVDKSTYIPPHTTEYDIITDRIAIDQLNQLWHNPPILRSFNSVPNIGLLSSEEELESDHIPVLPLSATSEPNSPIAVPYHTTSTIGDVVAAVMGGANTTVNRGDNGRVDKEKPKSPTAQQSHNTHHSKKKKKIKGDDLKRLRRCYESALIFIAQCFLNEAKSRDDISVFSCDATDNKDMNRIWKDLGSIIADESPKTIDAMQQFRQQLTQYDTYLQPSSSSSSRSRKQKSKKNKHNSSK